MKVYLFKAPWILSFKPGRTEKHLSMKKCQCFNNAQVLVSYTFMNFIIISVQKQDFDSGFSDTIPKPNQWMTGQRDHSRTGLVWYSGPQFFIKAWPLKQYLLILYSINVDLSMELNLQKCSECSLTAQIKLQSTLSLEWGCTSTLIAVMSQNGSLADTTRLISRFDCSRQTFIRKLRSHDSLVVNTEEVLFVLM